MEKCKAKRDVKFVSSDERFVDFKKDNLYRCMFRTEDIVLLDDYGRGVICDIDTFDDEFELMK